MALETHTLLRERVASKSIPRKQRELERQLSRRLEGLYDNICNTIVREISRRNNLSEQVRLQIAKRVLDFKDSFQGNLSEAMGEAGGWGRRRSLSSLQRVGMSIDMATEGQLPSRASELLANEATGVSKYISDRLRKDVAQSLSEYANEGIGNREAAERLNERFSEISKGEAEKIATTEINSAQNLAAEDTLKEYGVSFQQWWTSKDERVRDSHSMIHGEIVEVGSLFSNGLEYPGDKRGVEAEWIRCRCRTVPFLMPEGYTAPSHRPFYENELVKK